MAGTHFGRTLANGDTYIENVDLFKSLVVYP